MEVTIDKYGRIVVPESLRNQLGIGAGTEFTIEVEGDRLVLRPISDRSTLQTRDGLLVSTAEVAPDIDVEEVIDEVRTARVRTIAGPDADG
jgi:AbrB family looped-hinge helix DNA binding protein